MPLEVQWSMTDVPCHLFVDTYGTALDYLCIPVVPLRRGVVLLNIIGLSKTTIRSRVSEILRHVTLVLHGFLLDMSKLFVNGYGLMVNLR